MTPSLMDGCRGRWVKSRVLQRPLMKSSNSILSGSLSDGNGAVSVDEGAGEEEQSPPRPPPPPTSSNISLMTLQGL